MSSFFIRSSTVRLGIWISTLIIATIFIYQLIWLKKVYAKEQKDFDRSVIKVIGGLYEDLEVNTYYTSHLNELIEKPEPHLYLSRIQLPVNTDSLVSYLQYELEDFGVFTNCKLGVYDSASDKYIYTELLTSAGTKEKTKGLLPQLKRSYDYIALYFPNRGQYILSQINTWIISSIALVVLLILFSAGLYYFYRQKFLQETQKDLIHNFTHEFKTPVSVISLAADVLKQSNISEKPEKLATYAGIVEYQAHYMQTQIGKLLQSAHSESRQFHLRKETVNIHSLITEAVSNLSPLINEKKAVLNYELNAGNPVVQADKDYILIVITNLLDNALKYSKSPKINIATTNIGQHLQLGVSDNGIGIEEKELKKLFRKFYRINTGGDTYVAKGFGLGLAFVKKIVTAHGGKIRVESAPGKGSTFLVDLPLH